MNSSLPHVTDVLFQAGLLTGMEAIPEVYMQIGTATHLACELLDRGDLNESSLDPAIVGRVEAYKRFKAEMQPEILAIEEAVGGASCGYVGRLDRIVVLDGRRSVLDMKGPTQAPWHGVQLAAYSEAATGGRYARHSLHLHDDGTYRLIEHKSRNDWNVFRAALSIYNWKQENSCLQSR